MPMNTTRNYTIQHVVSLSLRINQDGWVHVCDVPDILLTHAIYIICLMQSLKACRNIIGY